MSHKAIYSDTSKFGATSQTTIWFGNSRQLQEDEVEEFMSIVLSEFNKKEVKQRLCDKLTESFEENESELPAQPNPSPTVKSKFDTDYFMLTDIVNGQEYFKNIPNVFIPGIRSSNIELNAPIAIFPYSYKMQEGQGYKDRSKIVIDNYYKGNIPTELLDRFFKWADSFSEKAVKAVLPEYHKMILMYDVSHCQQKTESGILKVTVSLDGKSAIDTTQFPDHLRNDLVFLEIIKPPTLYRS